MKTFGRKMGLGFVVVAALSLCSVGLSADDMPERGSIPFGLFDADKDGVISETEYTKVREARSEQRSNQNERMMKNVKNAPTFQELDSDKDGKVTKIELLEGQNKKMQENRSNRGPANR